MASPGKDKGCEDGFRPTRQFTDSVLSFAFLPGERGTQGSLIQHVPVSASRGTDGISAPFPPDQNLISAPTVTPWAHKELLWKLNAGFRGPFGPLVMGGIRFEFTVVSIWLPARARWDQ